MGDSDYATCLDKQTNRQMFKWSTGFFRICSEKPESGCVSWKILPMFISRIYSLNQLDNSAHCPAMFFQGFSSFLSVLTIELYKHSEQGTMQV